jgi:hypothetical protein
MTEEASSGREGFRSGARRTGRIPWPVDDWLGWMSERWPPDTREALLDELTREQRKRLSEDGYTWARQLGVVWESPEGVLRRAHFTHGTHFRTARAEYYINSQGDVRGPLL